jgi:hypothetical protein
MPSTLIAAFDYDAAHARLTITFTTGRIYQYFAVPAATARDFKAAFSKGSYFNRHIRNNYPFRELVASDPQAAKRSAR